jgi:multiple sugar transport system permease protein
MTTVAVRPTLDPTPAPGTRRVRTKIANMPPAYRRRVLWYLMLPAVLLEVLVYVVPILAGVFTSFTKVNQFTIRDWFNAPFAGLDNFKLILGSSAVGGPILRSLLLSLGYVVVVVSVSLVIGFLATIFVRSLRRARFFQIFFVIPYAIPVYAGVLAWDFAFQGNGAVNTLLHHTLKITGDVLYLQDPFAFSSLVITSVWRTWPFVFLMMLAATSNIGTELFEAIQVDGGGRWDEVRHIILPHVIPTIGVLALLLFVWNFNDFVTPFVFFGQIAPQSGNLFLLNTYTTTFVSFAYSVGAAITLLAVIVLALFIVFPYIKLTQLGDQ